MKRSEFAQRPARADRRAGLALGRLRRDARARCPQAAGPGLRRLVLDRDPARDTAWSSGSRSRTATRCSASAPPRCASAIRSAPIPTSADRPGAPHRRAVPVRARRRRAAAARQRATSSSRRFRGAQVAAAIIVPMTVGGAHVRRAHLRQPQWRRHLRRRGPELAIELAQPRRARDREREARRRARPGRRRAPARAAAAEPAADAGLGGGDDVRAGRRGERGRRRLLRGLPGRAAAGRWCSATSRVRGAAAAR